MTTFDFKLSLPDKLRREAEKAGLLTPQEMERLLREELRRRRVDGLFTAADKLASLDIPPLTAEEVEEEIRKVRGTKVA